MRAPLALSVTLAGIGRLYGDDLAALVDTARRAEDAGVGQLVVTDHLAIGRRTDRYPYGRFPFPSDEPWPEPFVLLAAMAGATRRIRLGTGILVAPLRPALLLAKSTATLDALSRGRLDLGVGTGWQREEFDAAGVPFADRSARLDDQLRACRVLWTGRRASFASPTVRFDDVVCAPSPVQPGGIPLWLGMAPSDRNLPRFTEFDAGWMPVGSDTRTLREGVARLRAARLSAGLDPDALRVRANVPAVADAAGHVDLDATLAGLPALREAGATVAAFALARFVPHRDAIGPFLSRLGRIARDGP